MLHIPARTDYAVRALLELADSDARSPVKAEVLVARQGLPPRFLEAVLADLRRADLVDSKRGMTGGYWITRPASDITIAEIIEAMQGPLVAHIGGAPMPETSTTPEVESMWRDVIEQMGTRLREITLADVLAGTAVGDGHVVSGNGSAPP